MKFNNNEKLIIKLIKIKIIILLFIYNCRYISNVLLIIF